MTQIKNISLEFEITFLKDEIINGKFPISKTMFKGADISILPPRSKWIKHKVHFFDNDMRVITPYAKELSGLIFKMKDIAYRYELIDFSNKELFFLEIGIAANSYFKSNDDGIGKVDELMFIVIHTVEDFINNVRRN